MMQNTLPIFLPFLSFLIGGLIGHRVSTRLYNWLSCSLLGAACFFGWKVFYSVIVDGASFTIPLFKWIEIGKIASTWTIVYTPITVTMVVTVLTVSFLVHVYSTGYMEHDDTPKRFMAYLGLFTFMMLVLVVADDMFQLFFGWEGVGLASYLLIGYWYVKPAANAAAMKAFIVNRIGDLGLIIGIACLYLFFKTIHIDTILSSISKVDPFITAFGMRFNAFEIMAALLFVGAMGKSAQLGLHTWLPDAMEGPTPVSALIHAATMVTAGVFLVARLSPLYEVAVIVKGAIIIIGAVTAFFAGTIALTQTDIKRVIAYSTCSQLGYMFLATGLSAYNAALFHLVTHAFFKALLFLGAGSVIHAMSDEQDMRQMGGLWRHIPKTYVMMVIGTLSITGVPFFSGFFSKEAILDAARDSHVSLSQIGYLLGIISTVLTALYSWRLIFLTFHGTSRASEIVQSHLHEPGARMLFPLWILVI
ncbi:MAG: NADH-quinone oxidoreductase subunit L, partial [Candidatus Nucleicultricaceae bacterium]